MSDRAPTCSVRLQYMLDHADIGLWDQDLDTGALFLSSAWRRILGLGLDTELGDAPTVIARFVHPDDQARITDIYDDLCDGRRTTFETEYRLRHADGSWIWMLGEGRIVERHPDGRPRRLIGTNRYITEARRIGEARRTGRLQLQETLDGLPIAVAVVGPDGTSLHNNPACERITGLPRSALVGLNNTGLPWAMFDESGRRVLYPEHEIFAPWLTGRAVRGIVLAHFPIGAEEPVWTISDFVPHFHPGGELRHVVCSFTDITVLRRIKASLARTHRFEGLAHLAGAVAHDFNNLLATVLGSAEVVGLSLPDGAQARQDLERIVEAAQRGAALTHQLLTYARRQPGLPRVVELAEKLRGQVDTLEQMLGRRVALEVRIHVEPLHVVIDPGQFEQLVSSLVVNAKEAMAGGGRVLIELDIALHLTSADGRPMVVLRITDDGEGIPADVLPHIFDPMFTTRHLDMGSGLGLATCDGIVRQHGGRIAVRSRLGVGTTFEVALPRARSLPTLDNLRPPLTPVPQTTTVLLVETDPTLSAMARSALERHGHRVFTARDAAEAEDIVADEVGLSALIIADNLPDTDGATLAGRLTRRFPGTAVLFVRNPDNRAPAPRSFGSTAAFIFRPFGAAELISRLDALLSMTR